MSAGTFPHRPCTVRSPGTAIQCLTVLRQKWRLLPYQGCPHSTGDTRCHSLSPPRCPRVPHSLCYVFSRACTHFSRMESSRTLRHRKGNLCISLFLLSAYTKETSMKRAFTHLYPSAKSVESTTVGRRRKHKQPKKKKKNTLLFQREHSLTQCVAERLSYGELQGPVASVSFL